MLIRRHGVAIALIVSIIFVTVVSETTVPRTGGDPLTTKGFDQNQNYNIYSRLERTHDQQAISRMMLSSSQDSSNTILGQNNEDLARGAENSLMNSSWPMYCHDLHHTGRSQYNNSNNPQGVIIWSFNNSYLGGLLSSPAIGTLGIIYLVGFDLFALYPNGTIKWEHAIEGWGMSCPALDANGNIYVASAYGDHNYLYAFDPNGTMKWRYFTGNDIYSSPAIGNDGTIYLGSGYSIIAVNPNGTLRWQYPTGFFVYSSPAIGDDGTVYCGSHDTYLYALYPNNGTLKWRFKTGDWVRVSPCIGADGTIYCVSLDNNLYALRPNGTMKWSTYVGAGTDPTIGPDGTIYAGWDHLYAVNPINGSVKWVADDYGEIWGGTPCISNDGIIYYGTSGVGGNGNIIAINPNGTLRWIKFVGNCESALAIGLNGTVYFGANDNLDKGHLYAFGRGPLRVEANGPYSGFTNTSIQFTTTIFGGVPPYTYHWDFGDGTASDQQNPTHNYTYVGNYTAVFTVKDSEGNQSSDTASVTIYYPPPTVVILKPRRAIYIANLPVCPFPITTVIGPLTIKVLTWQTPYGINRVEFYDNGYYDATDTTVPYQWTWKKFYPPHITTITVIAYDNAGHSSSKTMNVIRII